MAKLNITLKLEILKQYGSQKQFSMLTGIRNDTLSMLCRGRIDGTKEQRRIICEALDKSEKELFEDV